MKETHYTILIKPLADLVGEPFKNVDAGRIAKGLDPVYNMTLLDFLPHALGAVPAEHIELLLSHGTRISQAVVEARKVEGTPLVLRKEDHEWILGSAKKHPPRHWTATYLEAFQRHMGEFTPGETLVTPAPEELAAATA